MLKEREIADTIKSKINNTDNFFKNARSSAESMPAVGWFCTYAPEELITAGGYIPLRISGRKKLTKAESYFPINFCPYIKSGWESLLDDTANFKGLIFTNSCDGMRRFFDIAGKYLKDTPSHLLDVPHLKGRDSIDFFAGNIDCMKLFIEKLKGKKISITEIEKAIITTNEKRKLLKELNRFFRKYPGILNISTYFKIMELGISSKPETFSIDLKKYLRFLKEFTGKNKTNLQSDYKNLPSIMIIGNFIAEKKLWEILSTMNLRLAFDDLCTSSRYFEKQIKLNYGSDPITAIAERYLNKPQCMRMADLGFKLTEIKNNIIKNDIKGVIFISLKFCDTMLYSFPILKKKLNEMGTPILYLDIEYNNFSEGQVKTRLQAFLEML